MTRRRRDAALVWAVAALSLAVTLLTLRYHSWTASGADASGYVSQAELWLHGTLTVPQPLALEAPWTEAEWTFAPLGYRPALTRGAVVPTYPVGLPLMLAAAQWAGGRPAVYVVVPLLAGLGIWVTFLLGRQIAGPVAGAVAATLLAASPIWLRQSTQVMSDVPAATWWTVALALAYRRTPRAAFGAGLAGSLAVAIRPNLAPVAAAIAAAILASGGPMFARWARRDVPRDAPTSWPTRARRLAWFAAGLLPGCLLVAWVHTHLYGAPWLSGYGRNADLYSLANVAPNARLYAAWLAEGQTPMLLLAFGAGLLRRRPRHGEHAARAHEARAGEALVSGSASEVSRDRPALWPLWLLIVLVIAMYLPYAVFEAWWYIRFLLPAFPAAFILTAMAIVGAGARVPRPFGSVVVVAVTACLVAISVARARALDTLDLARDERRYAQMSDVVATSTPRASAFVCMQHSGSVRYYLDRPILRWELLPPDRLDAALAYLQAKGFRPYILLDSWEAPRFRTRFANDSVFGRLDWPPILELRSPTPVRLYDPADRARYFKGAHVPTRLVFQPRR